MSPLPRKPRSNGYYGWKPQLPDTRDYKFQERKGARRALDLPPSLRLTPTFPVYDQKNLGSCTANAALALYRYTLAAEGKKDIAGSRLFEYYYSRSLEGSIMSDDGAEIRDAIKVMATVGVARESDWPYLIAKFSARPTASARRYAKRHVALRYLALDAIQPDANYAADLLLAIQTALVENKPAAFGFTVYNSFESAAVERTGIVPMPAPGETVLGGHAVTIMGYDTAMRMFTILNSWGADWGMAGYCFMPFEYVLDPERASDFWCIEVAK